jgi:hypothetical protein
MRRMKICWFFTEMAGSFGSSSGTKAASKLLIHFKFLTNLENQPVSLVHVGGPHGIRMTDPQFDSTSYDEGPDNNVPRRVFRPQRRSSHIHEYGAVTRAHSQWG